MPKVRTTLPLLALLVALCAGCGSAPAAPTAATTSAASATGAPGSVAADAAPSPLPAPGTVELTGDLRTPASVTSAQLAGMPQHTVDVTYTSAKGPQHKKESGVLLADVLAPTALATTAAKNDALTFGVLAVGADGYAALVSYGEISPDFGNRGILLATAEDGTALARPRLVVPGDVKGGRYVSDLVELRVVRTAR